MLERANGKVLAEIEVGVEPEGMSVSPDDKIVAATSEATSMAHIIDTTTFEVLANILVDTRPRVATFTHDGKHVWVSAEVGGTVAVIDAATYKITKKLHFEIPGVRPELIQPMGIIFSKDGKQAFVAIGRANRIAVIDTATYETTSYILTGQRPWHMALSPDGTQALFGQRPHQRHDGHRCRQLEGGEIRAGRPPAVGHRHQAEAVGRRSAPRPRFDHCTIRRVPSVPMASPAFRSPQDSPRNLPCCSITRLTETDCESWMPDVVELIVTSNAL